MSKLKRMTTKAKNQIFWKLLFAVGNAANAILKSCFSNIIPYI
jgi:hypothetical protein